MSQSFDIVIVGAGLVGTSLALALADLPLKIALLEAAPIKTELATGEGRQLALTISSINFLDSISVWQGLQNVATPVQTVHVSHAGHFGALRLHAIELGVSALGHVTPAAHLGMTLNQTLLANKKIHLFNPARVQSMVSDGAGWSLQVEGLEKFSLQAKLVIAADGTHSTIRELQKIPVKTHDYQQSAIVTTVAVGRLHQQVAYERFLANGAIALLPLADNRSVMIWTGANAEAEKLCVLDDDSFLQATQKLFGYRLGKFSVCGKRFTYPLKMLFAEEQIRPGLAIIGNAAHTLHPIAAQGLNLGLQDVMLLTAMITDAVKRQADFCSVEFLRGYADKIMQRQSQLLRFTDSLTFLFNHNFLPLNLVRNSGMVAVDCLPWLKRRLSERLVGI